MYDTLTHTCTVAAAASIVGVAMLGALVLTLTSHTLSCAYVHLRTLTHTCKVAAVSGFVGVAMLGALTFILTHTDVLLTYDYVYLLLLIHK